MDGLVEQHAIPWASESVLFTWVEYFGAKKDFLCDCLASAAKVVFTFFPVRKLKIVINADKSWLWVALVVTELPGCEGDCPKRAVGGAFLCFTAKVAD